MAPARSFYRTGQDVTVTAQVFDRANAPIAGAEVTWTVEPQSAATAGDAPGSYTLAEEGPVTFRACTVVPGAGGEPVCGQHTLLVDDDSPLLEVTAPRPGAELGGDGATDIVVEGSVSDTRGATVFVNGISAPIDKLGQFSTPVLPRFGVNHIEVVASDSINAESRVELDVLWAEGYLPAVDKATGQPRLALDSGIALQLGQLLFDDDVPLDMAAKPLVTRDLADVLELVVANLDVAGQLPNGGLISDMPDFRLQVTAVRLLETTVDFDILDGGLELVVRIGRLQADTMGSLTFQGETLDLAGGIDAIVSAYARLHVSKPPDGPIDIGLDELNLAVESATPRFVDEDANALFRVAESNLRMTLEGQLSGTFEGTLAGTLPSLLSGLITALDTALAGRTIPIETEFFPPVTINFDGRVSALETAFRERLRATLTTAVSTDGTAQRPKSRGVASGEPGGVIGELPFFEQARLQLAVRLTLLNGLLHTLWNSGLLDIDATTLLPKDLQDTVTKAQLTGMLPPVARPARPGEPYDLVLTVGQLELQTQFLEENTRFGISFDAGVTLGLDGNRISVTIAEKPVVNVWTIETDAKEPILNDELLTSILIGQLWPELRGAFADGLTFDLPIPDLGELTSISPALAGFQLGLSQAAPLAVRNGVVLVEADLLGTLP